jgi:hypothetical protein|nr:MAG TPA: hypothetical protein [Caudoviricetes sp.]
MNLDKILIPNRLAVRISKLGFETSDLSYKFTWEEAFDFFRKEGYIFSIEPYLDFETEHYDGYNYFIEVVLSDKFLKDYRWFETYEEAREACLEKLILVKEGDYNGMGSESRDNRVEERRMKLFQEYLKDPKKMSKIETKSISDGYHTFEKLYEFRKMYNALLFNQWALEVPVNKPFVEGVLNKFYVHKSWKHYDGEWCFGEPNKWFIVCAKLDTGLITNHYKAEDWELFKIPETEKCIFEFDGHTPQDTLVRMNEQIKKDNIVEKNNKINKFK